MAEDTLSKIDLAYRTAFGRMYRCKFEEFVTSYHYSKLLGKVDLILTSPPFPLNRKKRYGNLQGDQYVKWLSGLAHPLVKLLRKKGSIVMELGNSWVPGEPVMSTLGIKALLAFLESEDLYLCQQFVWHNPAKLPSPAQWVNVERMRVKDSFTHIWWMSPTPRPRADNRRVLVEYSESMKNLLATGKYNAGKRPSEHNVGIGSFLKRNRGAIPPNVLVSANTSSNDVYLRKCRKVGLSPHPARMPKSVPEFFIRFLTKKGSIVMDPFGGSNTTGAVAQELGRRWVATEPSREYIKGSKLRFAVSN